MSMSGVSFGSTGYGMLARSIGFSADTLQVVFRMFARMRSYGLLYVSAQ